MSDTITRTFFVTHIGNVTVNNHGTVQFTANAGTPVGYEVRELAKIIVHANTIKELARGVREAMADMKKEIEARSAARIK